MKLDIMEKEYFNAADYFVDQNIREGRKNKVAVLCEDRRMTYGELAHYKFPRWIYFVQIQEKYFLSSTSRC